VAVFLGDEIFENAQKDAFPALRVGQLLRSCEQALEEGAGFGELGFDFCAFGVAEIHADACLSGVAGLAGDASEKFGPCCHGLPVPLAIHESRVEAPPVVDLGDEAGCDLATLEVLRGEPGPTPLVARGDLAQGAQIGWKPPQNSVDFERSSVREDCFA
jgi:hypothetical protein